MNSNPTDVLLSKRHKRGNEDGMNHGESSTVMAHIGKIGEFDDSIEELTT